MNEPPLDATALASWLDLSDEDREVLTVGFWVVSQALAPPDVPRSEEYVAAQDAIRTVWSATRSGVVKGVFSTLWLDVRMLESEPNRMDRAFLRVAEMHQTDRRPSEPVARNQIEAVVETTRRVLGKLAEGDRRRYGVAVVWMLKAQIVADSGRQSLPRDEKVVRATNILAALGIDADADWAWVQANGG